jgi:serine/threonine protein kinase
MDIQNSCAMMIDRNHQIITTLGIGGAGEVYSLKNVKNNTIYAAKFARKDLKVNQAKKLMLLKRERDTMEELHDHPNILSSYHLYSKRKDTPQNPAFEISKQSFDSHLTTSPFHLIEYCENGSFITYMKNQKVLNESIVTFYTEQLISAVEYIHYKGYAHLDIKLDNIMLDDYFNMRLSDFGSALKVEDDPITELRRGTPKYMAPEVLNLQPGEAFDALKADMYSMGVCIYLMLFKRFPVYKEANYPVTNDLFDNPDVLES